MTKDDYSQGGLYSLAVAALDHYALGTVGLEASAERPGTFCLRPAVRRAVYTLTLHDPARSAMEVAAEMAWLASLGREGGLRGPKPIATRLGGWGIRVGTSPLNREWLCTVVEEPSGRQPGWPTVRLMRNAGRLLGRLHQHSATYGAPAAMARVWPVRENPGEGRARGLWPLWNRSWEAAQSKVRGLGKGADLYGWIHGGMEVRVLRSRPYALAGFEHCGLGYFHEDLLALIGRLKGLGAASLEQACLEGYREIRPLFHRFQGLWEVLLEIYRIEGQLREALRAEAPEEASARVLGFHQAELSKILESLGRID